MLSNRNNQQAGLANESLAAAIRLACVWEATASKPGNVHPSASFADLTYSDFVESAAAVAPILARTAELGVGRAVFDSIQSTRAVVRTNTNLGIVLLIAPLAAVPPNVRLRDGIGDVLRRLTREDAAWVYRAIRLAQPGGLGESSEQDVANAPTGTLLEVMSLAADRDGVAAQYANSFAWVLNEGVPFLAVVESFENRRDQVIIELQLRLMSAHPDTLIARKCGAAEANESAWGAQAVLDAGWPRTYAGKIRLTEFDRWLRAEGNRRNPGTTADLVTACLFAAIRDGFVSVNRSDSVA